MSGFQAYVQRASDWASDLSIIVGGLESAEGMYAPPNAGAVTSAIGEIDGCVVGAIAPNAEALQASVSAILQRLHQALTSANAAFRLPPPATQPIPRAQQLQVSVAELSFGAWLLVALATTLAGSYILIFSANGAGFGTPADYLLCLLWGLGLPSASALLNMSTSGISAAFNITK